MRTVPLLVYETGGRGLEGGGRRGARGGRGGSGEGKMSVSVGLD